MSINEFAVKAKYNEDELNKLLDSYKPFIASCAGKTCRKYIDEHDDEMSIAMIAFAEAVRRFSPDSGNFLNFAGNVIRCRVIDYLRENNRSVQFIPLDTLIESNEGNEKSEFDDPVKLEIQALSGELNKYGFNFFDVAEYSPKSHKTKTACAKIVNALMSQTDLIDQIKETHMLPVHKLELITKIPRKTIDRHRKYIVCLAEIISGEYSYLAEYIKYVKDGDI